MFVLGLVWVKFYCGVPYCRSTIVLYVSPFCGKRKARVLFLALMSFLFWFVNKATAVEVCDCACLHLEVMGICDKLPVIVSKVWKLPQKRVLTL